MKPDDYYGDIAENYDRSRGRKPKWRAEIDAIRKFVESGPVLDMPLGTGRFIPVYREKGVQFVGIDISDDMLSIARQKYGEIDAHKGSAFDLMFKDGSFGTVVCVRFLEWLPLDRAKIILDRLRRVAPVLIVTITHGNEGQPEAYTYDFDKFLAAIDGLMIEGRHVTAHVRDMISEIFKLRPAVWSDVLAQFQHDYPESAGENIQRLADKFADFLGLPIIQICADTVKVRAEYWDAEKIGTCVARLADYRFVTATPPRHSGGHLTVIERDGKHLMIDGRKRANRWMKESGLHPVLVLHPQG